MRKIDYLTLAKELRQRVAVWSPADCPALGETHEDFIGRKMRHLEAVSFARYCAEHLSVDRDCFLSACGVRP